MVIPSSFAKYSDRLSLSPLIKKMNVDKSAHSKVRTETDNKKSVLHKFRKPYTQFSVETNIVKSSAEIHVIRGHTCRLAVHVPRVILTPTVDRKEDEAVPFMHQKQLSPNYKRHSGSFRVNRNAEERRCPSTRSLHGPSSSKVYGRGTLLKVESSGVQYRGSEFHKASHKQSPTRAFLTPDRYLYRPKISTDTKPSEVGNKETETVLDTKSKQGMRCDDGRRGTCSETHYRNDHFTRNAVSCSDLIDIQTKEIHDSNSAITTNDSNVETVYAIFAHESGKQPHTKFVRICDSVESFFSDYIENETLHDDSFEGFQDVDLSIDPSCVSFSDDEF